MGADAPLLVVEHTTEVQTLEQVDDGNVVGVESAKSERKRVSVGLSTRNEAERYALCGVDEESAEKTCDSVPDHLASEDLEDSQGGVETDVVEEVYASG